MINDATLPVEAKARLRDLQAAMMSAEDAGRAAAGRLNNMPPGADPELRDRLASEQQRQADRHRHLTQLFSRCNQFLAGLRNVTLEPVPAVDVELKPGETGTSRLAAVRHEIAGLKQQLAAVRSASLPKADQKKLAEDCVVRLMRDAKVGVVVANDQLKLNFTGDLHAPEDVLSLLAWSNPEAVLGAIEREIERQPVHSNAMPADQRRRKVAELEAQLDQAERLEQAIIGDGDVLLQRVDVSVPAFLGLVITRQQAAVA